MTDKLIETVAEAIANLSETYCKSFIDEARAAIAAIEASGTHRVVKTQRLVDYFAEIDDAATSITGALRHYQHPQDVHFHRIFKACRDAQNMLAAAPKVTE